MNEQTKAQVEAYAEECRTEQLELLRTLGKMPAPTRKEDFAVFLIIKKIQF